jgi:hypothetical protein
VNSDDKDDKDVCSTETLWCQRCQLTCAPLTKSPNCASQMMSALGLRSVCSTEPLGVNSDDKDDKRVFGTESLGVN